MSARVAPRRSAGFTLVEVLVSLVLLALLLAGAWGGIHTAVKAIHSGDVTIERMNRLRLTEQFLRRQLSHAMPLAFARDDMEGTNIQFEGDATFMRFVAPMPGYLSRGGSYVQTLEINRAGRGMELVFTNQMLNGFDEEDADAPLLADAPEPVLLIDGIARGEFLYRGLDEEGQLGDWTDRWETPDRLPVMVRVAFDMSADSGMRWPVLDVPLMLDVGSLARGANRMTGPEGFRQGRDRFATPDRSADLRRSLLEGQPRGRQQADDPRRQMQRQRGDVR